MNKTVFTLNVDGYAREITDLTYPLIRSYANKIGAEFVIINKRKWPELPVTYEKLQIFELGKYNDWNIYLDSDALVHPDFFDITEHIKKDTVLHNGVDLAGNRWSYDKYFRRDGRHIGSCNWFAVASDWCLDLWRPLDFEEEGLDLFDVLGAIHPTAGERQAGITSEHLIDDYVLSRNIARFGLKVNTCIEVLQKLGRGQDEYFFHKYTISREQKVLELRECINKWAAIPSPSLDPLPGLARLV